MVKEIPMLFSTPMVQAIINGTKTQTRRLLNPQPKVDKDSGYVFFDNANEVPLDIHNWTEKLLDDAKWQPEDEIWVRETFCPTESGFLYKADIPVLAGGIKWKPSLFMPKAACRIFLDTTEVSIERLQAISLEDAIAEGIERLPNTNGNMAFRNYSVKPEEQTHPLIPYTSYKTLWQKINGVESWDQNPWVWKISFKVNKEKSKI